ncbi:MAG: putative manganese-dependent inorganic diphosphatase [Mollicutes bacterium]|nr:putative manganese-dependent inorganic diphosphatase [Mollicutes bacterium]
MRKVYVFGHKKPDTDSVTGAIALAYLKNKMGINAEPRVLGEISPETEYALKKFNTPVPRYLYDVKIQLKDIKYNRNYFINQNKSIYETYNYLHTKGITGIPLVDDDKKYIGYVSLKEIAKEMIINSSSDIETSFDNLVKTLSATKYYQFDSLIKGKTTIINVSYYMFVDNDIVIDSESVVIGCTRPHVLEYVIKNNAKLVILSDNYPLSKKEIELIKEKKVNVIVSPYDTLKISRIICLANPINNIQRAVSSVCFEPIDYLSDFLEVSNKLKHTNYPIVNSRGYCEGMLRLIDTNDIVRKDVILVDHNDPSQSVDGLNEANIIEIVDHHNIGTINTNKPINFRNMLVGSVNTVIYHLFIEQGLSIPQNIAGLMLSGIISDTLLLKSPTTTKLDLMVADELAKIAKVDIQKYGLELLSSGVSIKGMSKEEIIYKDFKSYVAGEYRVGVAQVFTTTFDIYKNEIAEYVKELNEISENNNYKIVCLFVTDIINNDSYLLFNEKAKNYLEDAYGIEDLYQGYLLKGVVSRKLQMVPLILEVIEKL